MSVTAYSSVFAVEPREPFDELQVLGGAADGKLRREIRGLDDQRIALEAAARVAVAEADVARRMAPAQIDDALESLALPGVDADRDRVRPLHDAAESGEVRFRSRHAAVAHALILGAVVAVHALRVVERGHFGAARRWRPVLPAVAGRHLVLAGIGVLKEGQAELTVETVPLLSAAP